MSWPKVPMGDLVEITSGFAFKSELFNNEGRGFPLVRIRDVMRGHSETYYDGPFQDLFVVADGDVLIGMDGEFNVAKWAGGKALLNQRVCRVEARRNSVDLDYLFRFLPPALKEIEDRTAFVTVKHLSAKDIRSIEIPLPPLDEQRRIAAILDQADALRRKRREAVMRLNDMPSALFSALVGDPVTNPYGYTRRALVECCSNPDDIRCGPFGTQLLKEEFEASGVPLWGIRQVNRSFAELTHEFLSADKARKLSNYDLQVGDIVMTRKGTVGNCAVYPPSFVPGVMHSDLLRIRLSSECEPAFISEQLRSSVDVIRQIALISGGAIMPGINVGKLKSIEVLCPPKGKQLEFARHMTDVETLRRSAFAHQVQLDELFASLQHRAFSGEL